MAQVGSGASSTIAADQFYPQYRGPNLPGTGQNPVVDSKYQPYAVGKGSLLSTVLGMILFLVAMRIAYEVAK